MVRALAIYSIPGTGTWYATYSIARRMTHGTGRSLDLGLVYVFPYTPTLPSGRGVLLALARRPVLQAQTLS